MYACSFPSALAALRNLPSERLLPVALVGSGQGGDCAPRNANYLKFYDALQSAGWCVGLQRAGHFTFLDAASGLQKAVCPVAEDEGNEDAMRDVAKAVVASWAESMVRHRGACRKEVKGG